jgi:hypothetical protein
VADRLVLNLLGYLDRAEVEPRRVTVCAGGGACAELLQQLGVVTAPAGAAVAYGPDTLLVAGPGATAPQGLAQAVAAGMHVVCLGLTGAELQAWCPVPIATVKTNACFARIANPPPELNGLCNADWYWHGRMTFDALAVPDAEKTAMNSALRVVHHGKGCVVLWQVPPWAIDENAKPYLRTSKRRAEALAARLLANLGAGFRTPLGERFATPVEQAWLKSYYLDVPLATDDPYRYYRW